MSDLFPYQKDGVDFLLSHASTLLLDETGLGKTSQACGAIKGDAGPILIIAKNVVKGFWRDELVRWGGFAPEEVLIYRRGNNRDKDFFKRPGVKVFVIHWESVWLNEYTLQKRTWQTIIADESQSLRNRQAKQSKIVRKLKAERRYALTATPIINGPSDIWGILNFLFPKKYTSYWKFVQDYLVSYEDQWGHIQIVDFKDRAAFQQELAPFTLRRLKKDVLPDLPDKTYATYRIELGTEQRKVYEKLRKDFMAKIDDNVWVSAANALGLMMRLRQVASGLHLVSERQESTKIDAAVEISDLFIEAGKSLVVFSQFVGMVTRLQHELKESCRVIHGGVKETDREVIVEDFQKGLFPVLAITSGTGKESLTLTRADTILCLDKLWSPAAQEQLAGRIDRIGQSSDKVQIVSLIAENTVEDRVEQILSAKSAFMGLFDGMGGLSGRELKKLLS